MASQPAPEALRAQPIVRVAGPEQASLAALLQYEAEIRRQPGEAELVYHVANESRRILPYEQMFVLRHARIGEGFCVQAASSLATVDRNAPLIRYVEARVRAIETQSEPQPLALDDDEALSEYPFHEWHWQPLLAADGEVFAGLIIARHTPLTEAEAFRLARIADTAGHAWRALSGGKPVKRIKALDARQKKAIGVVLGVIALLPVQMSALAPVEVVPARPYVISSPFSGVVSRIAVPPSARVTRGQLLVQFEDVKLRNEFALATEKRSVARAKLERATTAAFGAAEESREIAIARAEYDLADAEFRYSQQLLAKTQIRAPRAGMAIYTDRREWEGRAVDVGAPIMQIADPRHVQLRIDLPTQAQMALSPGSHVKVWLDSQPFWAIDARLKEASYQARMTPENVLAFALTATPLGQTPRIGSRGTARVHGAWVPLFYSVLKRPIASARQYLGF